MQLGCAEGVTATGLTTWSRRCGETAYPRARCRVSASMWRTWWRDLPVLTPARFVPYTTGLARISWRNRVYSSWPCSAVPRTKATSSPTLRPAQSATSGSAESPGRVAGTPPSACLLHSAPKRRTVGGPRSKRPNPVRAPTASALGAGAFEHHVFGYPRPYPGQANWRLPRTLPPVRGTWQSGQLAVACSHRWVGSSLSRAKPWGRFRRSPYGAGGPVGLDPRRRLTLLHTRWRFPLALQLGDPGFQNLDMTKEPTNQLNQLLPGCNPAKSSGKLMPSVYPHSILFHSWAQRGLSPL